MIDYPATGLLNRGSEVVVDVGDVFQDACVRDHKSVVEVLEGQQTGKGIDRHFLL